MCDVYEGPYPEGIATRYQPDPAMTTVALVLPKVGQLVMYDHITITVRELAPNCGTLLGCLGGVTNRVTHFEVPGARTTILLIVHQNLAWF